MTPKLVPDNAPAGDTNHNILWRSRFNQQAWRRTQKVGRSRLLPPIRCRSPGWDVGSDRDSPHDSSQFQCEVGPARLERRPAVKKRQKLMVGRRGETPVVPPYIPYNFIQSDRSRGMAPQVHYQSVTSVLSASSTRPPAVARQRPSIFEASLATNSRIVYSLSASPRPGVGHTKHSPIAQLVERAAVNR